MKKSKVPASYQVIELVKEHISSPYVRASDTDAARALGISRAAVYGYKSGREFMGMSTLERAQTLIELNRNQLARLAVEISAEASKDPGVRHIWDAVRETISGLPPIVLMACLGLAGAGQNARANPLSFNHLQDRTLYIMRNWWRAENRKRRRGKRPGEPARPPRFLTWLPICEPSPLAA